jgi:hypothetical protein
MARRLADSDRQRSKEWADKISVSLRGHPVSQETRRKISEARAGKPVPSRQGMHYKEEVGYMGAHRRVRVARGTPSLCEHCEEDAPTIRYEWANLSGDYLNLNDYVRLCKACHNKMDGTKANLLGGSQNG